MTTVIRDTAPTATELQALAGKYLTFLLGGASYGIGVRRVREIIKLQPITPVPQTPASVKGVINLRGKVIPVVDLAQKFGVASQPQTERTCIVVVEVMVKSGAIPIGIIVDAVSDVTPIHREALEPPPDFGDHRGGSYIKALAKTEGGVRVLLDLDHVLADDAVSQSPSWAPTP